MGLVGTNYKKRQDEKFNFLYRLLFSPRQIISEALNQLLILLSYPYYE